MLKAAGLAAALLAAQAVAEAPSAVMVDPPQAAAVAATVPITPLSYGVPVIKTLSAAPGSNLNDFYDYYSYVYPGSGNGINVYVTMLNGHVDCYVSDASTMYPNSGAFNWSSVTSFNEVVAVPDASCTAPPCTYYIGLTPFLGRNTTYMIAVFNKSAPVQLQDGTPYSAYSDTNNDQQFAAAFNAASAASYYTIEVDAIFGIPLVYAALNLPAGAIPNANTPGVYSFSGSGELVISPSDPAFAAAGCAIGSPCPVSISVEAQYATRYYIETAADSTVTTLIDGVPSFNYLAAGQWQYFAYNVTDGVNVTVALTAFSGDPDIVASFRYPQPTISNADWLGLGLADEVLKIKTTDNGYPHGQRLPFTLYIGVRSYGLTNSSFSVLAVEEDAYWTMLLLEGQPQASLAPPHGFSYFSYIVDPNVPAYLDVSASPLSGSVDIYVSNMVTTDPVTHQTIPVLPSVSCASTNAQTGRCTQWVVDPQSYAWSTTYSGGNLDFLSIPTGSLRPNQVLYIGVLSTTQDSPSGYQLPARFSVAVSSNVAPLQLQDGIPVAGAVAPSGNAATAAAATRYYTYPITDFATDVVFVAEALTGALDIYVSDSTSMPGPGNSKWNTTGGGGGIVQNDVVYVPFSSLSIDCRRVIARGGICTLYIAVVGWAYMPAGMLAHYTLSGSESGSTTFPNWLSDGVGQAGYVPAQGYQYYYSYINIAPDESIYITVQNWQGQTEMWVNIGANKTWATAATGSSADIYAADVGGYETAVISPQSAYLGEKAALHAQLPSGAAVYKFTPSKAMLAAAAAAEQAQRCPHALRSATASGTMPTPAKAAALRAERAELFAEEEAALAGPQGRSLAAASLQGGAANNLWCSSCSMFVSIHGITAATYTLSYTSGDTIQPLNDNRAYYATAPASGYNYYSFQVTDANAAFRLQTLQLFGDASAYVLVQSPATPSVLPTAFNFQYRLRPWAGSPSLTVLPVDPNFCHSSDGKVTAPPCTYIIGVQGLYNQTAYISLLASNDEGTIITPLLDGVAATGSLLEGDADYYSFAAPAGGAPGPLRIQTQAFTGRTVLYVTNGYLPGISNPTLLPGPNSNACQWIGTNFSAVFIQSSDPCYNANLQSYTIAVVAASGVAGLTSEYQVLASASAEVDLLFGTPLVQQLGRANGNYNYSFVLEDASADIVISATPVTGEIGLLVRRLPDSSADQAIPACNQPAGGARITCAPYTWFATGMQGATAIYIPAAAPCSPVLADNIAPNSLLVNQSACASDWAPGRFVVTVYVYSDMAEFSVAVTRAGENLRLADGWPLLGLTAPTTICNNRDPNTGACNGLVFQPSGSFFTFTIPANDPPMDQFLYLEKLCEGFPTGQSVGNCGQDLQLVWTSCPASQCAPEDMQPFPLTVSQGSIIVNDATGSARISYDSCFPSGQRPLGNNDDCVYYVSVFSSCGASSNNVPSQGCDPVQFRLTYSDDSGIERIPADCTGLGNTCLLPVETVSGSAVTRYEAFAGQGETAVTARVYACSSDVNVFICQFGAASSCNPWSMPGAGNSDFHGSTSGANKGVFEQDFTAAGLFYMGIASNVAHLAASPMFQVAIATGSGPTLITPPAAPGMTVVRSATSMTVSWQPAVIQAPGQSNYVPAGLQYLVIAFPAGAVGNYYLTTPCGVAAAYGDPNIINTAQGSTAGTSLTLSGLTPSQAYAVAVVARCSTSTGCLPVNGTAQMAAYAPGSAPAASPTPVPAPSSNGSGGAIAGAIFGVLAFAGLVYLGYRYRHKFSSSSAAADAPWATSSGGGYARVQEWGGSSAVNSGASSSGGYVAPAQPGGDYTEL